MIQYITNLTKWCIFALLDVQIRVTDILSCTVSEKSQLIGQISDTLHF